ncbi:MAG: fused MFS/spermidine synthase [Gammaproteobacteria bacterium]|nr:fused MFS/spermidine synthase [Gammaproteobacteria bacterium]MBT3490424.1 fused MFS/spermidine synthase [Gammaproteobacteria bacterium]MBT3718110.1 fused MFS/spermidine synthase [Gammaproteobacteria bacterium]MBT3845576.1 fused MFS/spermidine synthase [Gammaproteobacteria bacterium]MBT3893314.1 fused MFS/spermidine synthase [Gammaproteobacteria bacterium]
MFFKRKNSKERVIYRHSDDDCGEVVVVDKGKIRFLKFGNHIKQGGIDLTNPDSVYLEYQQSMLSVFDAGSFAKCLCLGLGAGSIPKYIHQNKLCERLSVVEINPVVIDVAREYFALPTDVAVINDDALDFVRRTVMTYDLVIVDIFTKSGTPCEFKTFSFYRSLHELLRIGGVVVLNTWASDFNKLLLEETLGKIFDNVQFVKVSTNHIVFCRRFS